MFLLAKQGDFLFETQWKVEYSEIFHDVEIIPTILDNLILNEVIKLYISKTVWYTRKVWI